MMNQLYFPPYQPPYGPGMYQQAVQPEAPRSQPSQAGQSFAWVNNEQEARGFVVLPGNSVMLMSRNDPVFWVKATDQSGMPQAMRSFEYVERQHGPQSGQNAPGGEYVTYEQYAALQGRVEALEAKKCACKDEKEAAVNG